MELVPADPPPFALFRLHTKKARIARIALFRLAMARSSFLLLTKVPLRLSLGESYPIQGYCFLQAPRASYGLEPRGELPYRGLLLSTSS